MVRKDNLHSLFSPRSVAVVGATERPFQGSVALRNLIDHKFAGPIYPVNPRHDQVFGLRCYPNLKTIPCAPECVILAIPSRFVVDSLREAGEVGVRAAVILSAGFAEVGDEGRRLQDELAAVARHHGIAVCGPNCLGLANLVAPAPIFGAAIPVDIPRGRIGVVAQSGSIAVALMLVDRLACSYVVSSGNQAVVDATDYFEYLVEDPDTDVIALFLEAIPQPQSFLAAVARAHQLRKPVVVCKPGRSARAAAATMAHTGTLAGSYEVYASICQQYGIILVEDLDQMIETLGLLSGTRRIPDRPGVALVNTSGGENALILDIAQNVGLQLPAPSEQTAAALRSTLPDFAPVGNPLDVTGALFFDNASYRRCIRALADDESVGTMIIMQDLVGKRAAAINRMLFQSIADSIIELARAVDKPVFLLSGISGEIEPSIRELLGQAEVPVLEGMRKGLRAVAQYIDWATYLRRPGLVERLARRLDAVGNTSGLPVGLADAVAAFPGPIGERGAKAVLGQYGLPVTREALAKDAPGAVDAANALGYPVVLKIDSPDILHKTDVGGVRLGLADPAAVSVACEEMLATVRRRAPTARINGVLVQEMVTEGAEVVLGMKRDDGFGPMVLFGLGGVFVEVLSAFSLRQAPIDEAEAEEMIRGTPGYAVLMGARGRPPADLPALVHTLVLFSNFCVEAASAIREIDLNPVVVLPKGQGVRILDALFIP
ncbi:MAG: acetate--CoA ligase family protein [Chloroflexota bacterium]